MEEAWGRGERVAAREEYPEAGPTNKELQV